VGWRDAKVMRRLLKPLWIALAAAFLLEAWLWDHGRTLVAAVMRRIPWQRLKAGAKNLIAPLPPEGTLAVFAIPMVLLLPLKVTVVWLVLKGAWGSAMALLAFAKLFGLGMSAFAFDVCRDKLLQIPTFRKVYERTLAARQWAKDLVDPMIEPVRRQIRDRLGWIERHGTPRRFRFIIRLRSKMRREPSSKVA
jgi:hypothetical protein